MANATTKIVPFAVKKDTTTATWTKTPVTLMAVYVSLDNRLIYAVDEKNIIRKMSVTRDADWANKQFRVAKKLVGKKVYFGCTSGWSGDVWFNEVAEATE